MNLAMIRIALLGSRSAWGRLIGIAAGVAIGTAMFLLLLGAYKGLDRRDDRFAYLKTTHGEPLEGQGTLTDDNAFFAAVFDYFGTDEIDRFEIAVTPDTSVT
ncbi:MAG: ABC transporter permease, partial [Thermomicrobiales bacterium]